MTSLAIIIALQQGTLRTWYGGSTLEFGQFLSRTKVPEIVVDVGHVPIVPRMLFQRDDPAVLPLPPAGYFTLTSIYGRRLMKGSLYSPTQVPMRNSEDKFWWSILKTQMLTRANGGNFDVNGAYTLADLLEIGQRKLSFPNPVFGKSICYVNMKNVPAEQLEQIAAEMGEHDIVKTGASWKLVPRVEAIKVKLLRTYEEYAGTGGEPTEQLFRIDTEFLRGQPFETWRKILTDEKSMIDIDISKQPIMSKYEDTFRKLLRNDANHEDSILQSYFASDREPGFHVVIHGMLGASHYFTTMRAGRRTRHYY